MFFGLMIGVLTIYAGGKVATGFLVLGVPLIDLLLVTHGRIVSGRHPFHGSQHGEHLHHRLLDKGWSRPQVLTLTISLGLIFGITALFLSTLGKFILAIILFGVMVSLRKWSQPLEK
jgi:UDP-GlcNAc:undecaprenyl-phosphate GlcNAc-1-phosphate transferase